MDDSEDVGVSGLAMGEAWAERRKGVAMGRRAIEDRDVEGLSRASLQDAGWVSRSWKIKTEHGLPLDTSPLPEATRLGWAEGVARLAQLGADPSVGDMDRQGWGPGRPPLAVAVSMGRLDVAAALADAGARPEPIAQMVWAATFRQLRGGSAEGVAALAWLKAQGLDLWADDAAAHGAQSAYVFAGGSGSAEERRAWDEALFEGCKGKPGAMSCLWGHLFGMCADGKEPGPRAVDLWLSCPGQAARERAGSLLEWSLSGGCPEAARASARALGSMGEQGSREAAKAIAKACAVDRSDKGAAEGAQREAMLAAWAGFGPTVGASRQFAERCCADAMGARIPGLVSGLLDAAGVDPVAAMDRWVAEGSKGGRATGDGFFALTERCVVLLMAKALEAPGALGEPKALRIFMQRVPDAKLRFALHEDRHAKMLAEAQKVCLERGPAPAQGSAAPRMRL